MIFRVDPRQIHHEEFFVTQSVTYGMTLFVLSSFNDGYSSEGNHGRIGFAAILLPAFATG